METTNATIIPTKRTTTSSLSNFIPNFINFNKLAPNITGTAKKNVNSAATVRDIPIRSPPIIVAPEREVPGNTAAIS